MIFAYLLSSCEGISLQQKGLSCLILIEADVPHGT